MSALDWITLVAMLITGGFLSFLATQLVKRSKWPAKVNLSISLVMALVFGLAAAWLSGDILVIVTGWGGLSVETVLAFAAFVWTSATVWYRIVFKDAEWAADLADWPLQE